MTASVSYKLTIVNLRDYKLYIVLQQGAAYIIILPARLFNQLKENLSEAKCSLK